MHRPAMAVDKDTRLARLEFPPRPNGPRGERWSRTTDDRSPAIRSPDREPGALHARHPIAPGARGPHRSPPTRVEQDPTDTRLTGEPFDLVAAGTRGAPALHHRCAEGSRPSTTQSGPSSALRIQSCAHAGNASHDPACSTSRRTASSSSFGEPISAKLLRKARSNSWNFSPGDASIGVLRRSSWRLTSEPCDGAFGGKAIGPATVCTAATLLLTHRLVGRAPYAAA